MESLKNYLANYHSSILTCMSLGSLHSFFLFHLWCLKKLWDLVDDVLVTYFLKIKNLTCILYINVCCLIEGTQTVVHLNCDIC